MTAATATRDANTAQEASISTQRSTASISEIDANARLLRDAVNALEEFVSEFTLSDAPAARTMRPAVSAPRAYAYR